MRGSYTRRSRSQLRPNSLSPVATLLKLVTPKLEIPTLATLTLMTPTLVTQTLVTPTLVTGMVTRGSILSSWRLGCPNCRRCESLSVLECPLSPSTDCNEWHMQS
ncbi:hypothetical protein NP493_90g00016 [Ridgeia piscesae]|uniref:Uncharacterized protein n=1 Tax=Ridgeia piscesae TaxID=27915 RepID=A0AAD9P8E5_RIDPI|nr:hypothetical protein NP493_90g00016 [Ridgeia piscesae]